MTMVEYPSKLTMKRKTQTSCQPSSRDNSSAAPFKGKKSNRIASHNLQDRAKLKDVNYHDFKIYFKM